MLPEIFFKVSGILGKSIGNFGPPLFFHLFCLFYCIFMWQFLDNLHEFFFKSFWEKKCFWLLQKWRKFSDISAIFDGISGNFGLFLTRSKYRAFLGKVSRPMLLKFPSEFQIKYRAKYEVSANMATLNIDNVCIVSWCTRDVM